MQPRYLFIPHKDIIMEIIAYIMQLIAELEKSFSFFFFFFSGIETPSDANFFFFFFFFSISIEFPDGCVKRNVHGKYNFVSRKLLVSL